MYLLVKNKCCQQPVNYKEGDIEIHEKSSDSCSSFLIFIGIIISGEIYIEYISDFEDMPAVSFNSNNYNCKEMLNDLYNGAKEKGLLIGGISTQVDSIYTSRKVYTATKSLKSI